VETEKQLNKWIRRVKRSADEKAANALVKHYYREMLGYVYNRTKEKEIAMEITQEIFVSLLQSIDRFDEKKSSFRTWLYSIAKRRLADYYRSSAYKKTSQEVALVNVIGEDAFDANIE